MADDNYGRKLNFSAGPSGIPVPVLEGVRDNLMNHEQFGCGVMEMSHRSGVGPVVCVGVCGGGVSLSVVGPRPADVF